MTQGASKEDFLEWSRNLAGERAKRRLKAEKAVVLSARRGPCISCGQEGWTSCNCDEPFYLLYRDDLSEGSEPEKTHSKSLSDQMVVNDAADFGFRAMQKEDLRIQEEAEERRDYEEADSFWRNMPTEEFDEMIAEFEDKALQHYNANLMRYQREEAKKWDHIYKIHEEGLRAQDSEDEQAEFDWRWSEYKEYV